MPSASALPGPAAAQARPRGRDEAERRAEDVVDHIARRLVRQVGEQAGRRVEEERRAHDVPVEHRLEARAAEDQVAAVSPRRGSSGPGGGSSPPGSRAAPVRDGAPGGGPRSRRGPRGWAAVSAATSPASSPGRCPRRPRADHPAGVAHQQKPACVERMAVEADGQGGAAARALRVLLARPPAGSRFAQSLRPPDFAPATAAARGHIIDQGGPVRYQASEYPEAAE